MLFPDEDFAQKVEGDAAILDSAIALKTSAWSSRISPAW